MMTAISGVMTVTEVMTIAMTTMTTELTITSTGAIEMISTPDVNATSVSTARKSVDRI